MKTIMNQEVMLKELIGKKLKDAEHMYFLVGGDVRARDYINNEWLFEKCHNFIMIEFIIILLLIMII